MDDLNFSRCKEGSKELLLTQCPWQTLEADLGSWHLADEEWGKNEKKTGSRKSVRKENRGCFLYSHDRVGGAGRLLVSLSPVNVQLVFI